MSSHAQVPSVDLGDGVAIPQVGFGVWQVPAEDTERAVSEALEAGYRHIDTAAAYGNEQGVARAIQASGLRREEIFVTTKLWNADHGRARTMEAFASSMERLQLDVLDLYLIHWPMPSRDRYVETWEALAALHGEGRIRAIGVSNFHAEHLDRIVEATGVTPAIDQVELHPRLQQRELRAALAERGIVTEAYSPLGSGTLLDDSVIGRIAQERGKSPAQVILRWHLQLGNVVIPKSATPERIRENIDLFDFELTGEDLAAIEELDAGVRTGADPETFSLT
ncbi:MAG TPA: aldo/keto reductase [Baekduia sp.]|nr:aldo/keto reductase [Baekduia sp.]